MNFIIYNRLLSKPIVYIFFTVLYLNSCSTESQKTKRTPDYTTRTELAKKYNAYAQWDTLGSYTFELQEMFIEDNQPILFEGVIFDIDKLDTLYRLKLISKGINSSSNYIALVKISQQQLKKIKDQNYQEGYFIIKIESINSSLPSLKTEYVTDEEEDTFGNMKEYEREFSYLSGSNEDLVTILKGKLIDFTLIEL